MYTTIRITKELLELLKAEKIQRFEPYEDAIRRLIKDSDELKKLKKELNLK